MSDYIPFEIQVEIIKKLPVKSLMQFRSVSKGWKSLIDSSEFIVGYSARHTQPESNLVWCEYCYPDNGEKYVSVVDDQTFTPEETKPNILGFPRILLDLRVVGNSQGLWCLSNYFRDKYNTRIDFAALWNPSIRKSVVLEVPCESGRGFRSVVGFGVCPVNNEAMIVKITHDTMVSKRKRKRKRKRTASLPWIVDIFTLSRGSWRSLSSNLPNKLITVTLDNVAIDKFIYWFAYYGNDDSFGIGAKKLILSFDMITQEFRVVDLPDSFANGVFIEFSISNIRESLVVLEHRADKVGVVWMMNDGVPNSFTMMFTINKTYASMKILGCTKNGRPIIETVSEYQDRMLGMQPDYKLQSALVVYEPSSQHIKDIQFYGKFTTFSIGSNMDTLLLLDQSNFL